MKKFSFFYWRAWPVSLRLVLGMSLCLMFSGCALLTLPFKLAGAAIEVAKRMPKPPPGVF
ncbi:MAG: hypothetical protein NUV91_05530 [Candidatus Omnitrophica bacterium]|nr:hypothetical protein [Candidatus Omnitrophota bacterium]